MAGQDDDLHLGVALLDAAQHFETVHAGHAQVQDDDVSRVFDGFEGLRAVIGHARCETAHGKAFGKRVHKLFFVVYQQNLDLFLAHAILLHPVMPGKMSF